MFCSNFVPSSFPFRSFSFHLMANERGRLATQPTSPSKTQEKASKRQLQHAGIVAGGRGRLAPEKPFFLGTSGTSRKSHGQHAPEVADARGLLASATATFLRKRNQKSAPACCGRG